MTHHKFAAGGKKMAAVMVRYMKVGQVVTHGGTTYPNQTNN